MDGQQQTKLTRTQSSLLRSSPSIRSLPTISDDNHRSKKAQKPTPNPAFRLTSLAMGLVFLSLLSAFMYLKTGEISTSESLLLALIFIAVVLFYLGKNQDLIDRSKNVLRYFHHENRKGHRLKSVEWYIGDADYSEPVKKTGDYPDEMGNERVEFYSNGDYYEGEFNRGKCNGSGVYNYFINGRYEGDWVSGKYDGYGIESWSKGSKYRGQYRGGLRHGIGVYKFYTGDTYSGEWYNGQYHGVGIQTCSDGSCYVGEFKSGVKHGLGCYHFRNGDRYAGEYFGDKIHGFGVYHFANGHCYEGSWHEGRKQGYGMYSFRNGEAKCGEWDCGSLKTRLPQHQNSVLRTVLAARKVAENAIHLRRVDEQVNKAVTAANRAATAARVAAVKAVQNRMDGKFHDET